MKAGKLFYAVFMMLAVSACSSDDVVPVDNGPKLKSIFVGYKGNLLSSHFNIVSDVSNDTAQDMGRMDFREYFVQYNMSDGSSTKPQSCYKVFFRKSTILCTDSLEFNSDSTYAESKVTEFDRDGNSTGVTGVAQFTEIKGQSSNSIYSTHALFIMKEGSVEKKYFVTNSLPQSYISGSLSHVD